MSKRHGQWNMMTSQQPAHKPAPAADVVPEESKSGAAGGSPLPISSPAPAPVTQEPEVSEPAPSPETVPEQPEDCGQVVEIQACKEKGFWRFGRHFANGRWTKVDFSELTDSQMDQLEDDIRNHMLSVRSRGESKR